MPSLEQLERRAPGQRAGLKNGVTHVVTNQDGVKDCGGPDLISRLSARNVKNCGGAKPRDPIYRMRRLGLRHYTECNKWLRQTQ